MGYLTIGFRQIGKGLKTIFGKKSVAGLKQLEVPKAPKTVSFTNSSSGITTSQREFNYVTPHGESYIHLVKNESQVLPDGTKLSRSHVWGKPADNGEYHLGFGGDAIDRTKTISIEPDNILGGKTITINKNYKNTFGDPGRNETLVKVYDKDGILQHKELTIDYTNGSGYKVRATQDREVGNLTSSAKDMLEEPITHLNYKHELSTTTGRGLDKQYFNTRSNHGNFTSEGSAYSRALAAKANNEKAASEAAQEAQKAAQLASEKAAAELAAKRPRVNVGKVLPGYNIEDLKVVEKVQPNGGVKRYYFLPETGAGKRQPVITTYDHGSLHQEWIRNGRENLIYMKQIGEETPYIVAKKGNITQLKYNDSLPSGDIEFPSGNRVYHVNNGRVNAQFFDNGLNTARIDSYGRAERGRVTVDNYDYDSDLKIYGEGSEYLTKKKQYAIDNGNISHWDPYRPADRSQSANAARGVIKDIEAEAKSKRLDLEDLFKPFEAES